MGPETSQEVLCLLWKLNVYYSVSKSTPLNRSVGQMIQSTFFHAPVLVSYHLGKKSAKWSLSFRVSN